MLLQPVNKAAMAGIIIGVVVIIGVISAFSYNNNSFIKTDDKAKANIETVKTSEGQAVTPKKYSVNLTEAIGTAGNP